MSLGANLLSISYQVVFLLLLSERSEHFLLLFELEIFLLKNNKCVMIKSIAFCFKKLPH